MFAKIKLSSFALVFLLCFQNTSAANFPRGCEVTGFSFNDNHLILNESGEQSFYLIQNHANQQIEIERVIEQDAFMSPKLTTRFDPLRFAAFASDIQNLHFQCFTQTAGQRSVINCGDVLDVCQYPRAKFPLSNMGNYWISTNKSREQVIKDATDKGIYLRW